MRRPRPARRAAAVRAVRRAGPVPGDPRRRLVALLVVVGLAFAAVVVRLTSVQALSGGRYAAIGESQRLRTVTLPAERGAIFDRDGRELALSLPQPTVWADPRQVTDPAGAARALAPVLGKDEAFLRDRLTRDAAFVYLARKVDEAVARRVKALRLDGVALMDEPKRFSPAGSLAAPLLGRVGTDNQGLSGLELQFDARLAGRPGQLLVERDPQGHEIPAGVRQHRAARRGEDLVLTVDRSLQYETERALGDQILASNARGGVAVVMDPRRGDVLALANLVAGPEGEPPRPAPSNAAVTAVYEPGSVNKVITVAGALEEGLYGPATVLSVPDRLQVADHRFSDHDPHPTARWSVTDILANSSNIGTILIGQKLGKTRIDRYLRAFGFGDTTGIGFPGESAGLLLPTDRWSGTTIGTVPIGQGVAVTALQMLAVYNTLANGGVWVEPRFVRATIDSQGRSRPAPAPERRRVVSETTARRLTAMLAQAVASGTGKAAGVASYTVAGKTGTARKPMEGARGYKAGAYVASFAGFVPAEAPRLSAIVILDEPTPIYGGLVSAPVFARVARYALRLFRVPPATTRAVPAVPRVDPEAARPEAEFDGRVRPAATLARSPSASATTPTTTP